MARTRLLLTLIKQRGIKMKIDKTGIEQIQNTIGTPFQTLAEQLSEKGCLDKQSAEIVTFIFEQLSNIGEATEWNVIED